MNPDPLDPEFDRLLSGLCDGTLTGDEAAKLSRRLEASAADRQAYLKYVDLHAVLMGEIAFARSAAALGQLTPASRQHQSRSLARAVWLSAGAGIAVAMLLAFGIWRYWGSNRGIDPGPVGPSTSWARVVEFVGEVQILSENSPAQPLNVDGVIARGQTLRTGPDDSYAAVELADGTRLFLCPETQIRLSADDAERPGRRVVLSSGVLQVSVPALPGSSPLVVATPQVEIAVRETRMVVSSPDSRSTAVETESGEAHVTRTADGHSSDVPAGYFTVALENETLLPVRQIDQLPSEPRARIPLEQAQSLAYRGRQLLVAASYGENATFAIADQTPVHSPTHHASESHLVFAASDGSVLVRGDRLGRYEVFDPITDESLHVVETGIRNPLIATIAPGGKLLAVAEQVRGRLSSVRLWDVTLPTELSALDISGSIRCLAFSPDGTRLGVGSVRYEKVLENWLEVWDHAAERQIAEAAIPEHALRVVAFSPDATRVAGATTRGAVHVIDAASGAMLASRGSPDGWAHPVHSLAFSPDNQLLANGTSNGRVRLWNVATNRELGVLSCGTRIISALAFSLDGEELAVGAVRGPVLLFHLMDAMPTPDPL